MSESHFADCSCPKCASAEIAVSYHRGITFCDPHSRYTNTSQEGIDGPLSGGVYQRHAQGHWALIEQNEGFA